MRTKICGITNESDALYAAQHEAWALGFNFHPQSPRFIEENTAVRIIRKLPKHVIKVGIYVRVEKTDISRLMSRIGLNFLQVYEEVEATSILKKRMIFSLCVNHIDELPADHVLRQYGYILLDAPRVSGESIGGTGRFANWSLAKKLAMKYRVILAGGLTPQNIKLAIKTVKPYAVDVASGVQYTPGILDRELVKQFLKGDK